MNTPDQAPKNGDFVAYLEELERRHLPPSHPTGPTGAHPGAPKITAAVPVSTSSTAAAAAAAATIATSIPVGLVVIGLVLVIAGALFDGGIFVILIGVFLLWQAARAMVRRSRELGPAKSQAAQQIANLLATRAARKK